MAPNPLEPGVGKTKRGLMRGRWVDAAGAGWLPLRFSTLKLAGCLEFYATGQPRNGTDRQVNTAILSGTCMD